MSSLINIHSVIPSSRINGPGSRMVIFFQGCNQDCHGCFNPDTHSFDKINLYTPEDIFKKHLRKGIEGITVSGGEPFLQPKGLYLLLKTARCAYNLTTVVYTGFEYNNLKKDSDCKSCLEFIDVLIDGRYEESKKETTLLARGSTNQRFQFFTSRYMQRDFYMPAKAEITIGRDGIVRETGFRRIDIKQE